MNRSIKGSSLIMLKNMAFTFGLITFILFTAFFSISSSLKDGGAPMSLKEAQEAAEHDGGQAVVDFWRNFHIPSGENKGKWCAVETLTFNIYFDNGKCDWGNENLPDKLYYDNYIHKFPAADPVLLFTLSEDGGRFLGELVKIEEQSIWYWVEKATFAGQPITLNFDGCWTESPKEVAEALKRRHASLLFFDVVSGRGGRGRRGPLLYWTDGLEVIKTSAYGSRVTAELHPSATKYTHGWPDSYLTHLKGTSKHHQETSPSRNKHSEEKHSTADEEIEGNPEHSEKFEEEEKKFPKNPLKRTHYQMSPENPETPNKMDRHEHHGHNHAHLHKSHSNKKIDHEKGMEKVEKNNQIGKNNEEINGAEKCHEKGEKSENKDQELLGKKVESILKSSMSPKRANKNAEESN